MTCLSLVLTLALALQLGHLTTVAVYDGSAEKTCDLNKISLMDNFDPSSIDGKWYPVYKSHIPPYYTNVDLMFYELKYRNFTDVHDGPRPLVVANRTYIYNDGSCKSEVLAYTADTPGMLIADYIPYPDADFLVRNKVYVLGVDSNLLLFYHAALVNGVLSLDYTTLAVMVRDPNKAVTLPFTMQCKMTTFCGPTVANISYFQKYQFSYTATCSV